MGNASRDENNVPTLLAVSNADNSTPVTLWADPTTHRLLVKVSDLLVADLADGTDGELITWDATGAPTTIPVGTSGQILTSNGAGAEPTWEDPAAASPLTTKGDVYTYSTVDARLPVGTNGQVLTADSSEATGLKWTTVAGSGDVTKVGTPVDNQIGVWTGDGTIEGTADFTFDGSDLIFYDATNDGNPEVRIGAADAEELHIQTVYDSGAQTLDYVLFQTDVASATADKGEYRFNVDGTLVATFDDGGLEIKASGSLSFGAVDILSDSAGTTTLQNIDALDATTEATIEAAVDTLANLTSIQGLTVTLADAGANAIFGWDDVAGAYENLSQAEVLAVIGSASLTAQGVVELATAAETTTGTDATRAVTPDGLAGSEFGERALQIVVFDFTTDVATGDGKFYFHVDSRLAGMNIVDVHAEVITAGTTGTTDIQLRNVTQAADILSTKLTIDSGETGSDTAATAAVINAAEDDLTENDLIAVDVDAVSTTAPKGLIITIGCRLP